MSELSVTGWINGLKAGNEAAAQHLWERYFQRLVRQAQARLAPRFRRSADEEDVALSAFRSFFRCVEEGRFPRLNDRDDLWRILLTITERKAFGHIRHESREKRGGGNIQDADEEGGAEPTCPEPTPAFTAELVEEVQTRLNALPDDTLREIAIRKMEGFTIEEIATVLACSPRSVKRKIQVIRSLWTEEE